MYPYTGVSNFRNENKERRDGFPIKRMDVSSRAPAYNREWIVKSGCHFSCMRYSLGIQIVMSSADRSTNIQLCESQTVVRFSFLNDKLPNADSEVRFSLTSIYFIEFSMFILKRLLYTLSKFAQNVCSYVTKSLRHHKEQKS